MAGNRIATVNVDSIRFLNSLTVLDIRENQFQHIPLDVLNFLETHLQTLQLERKSHSSILPFYSFFVFGGEIGRQLPSLPTVYEYI